MARMKLQKLDQAEESLYQVRTIQRLMKSTQDLQDQAMALRAVSLCCVTGTILSITM